MKITESEIRRIIAEELNMQEQDKGPQPLDYLSLRHVLCNKESMDPVNKMTEKDIVEMFLSGAEGRRQIDRWASEIRQAMPKKYTALGEQETPSEWEVPPEHKAHGKYLSQFSDKKPTQTPQDRKKIQQNRKDWESRPTTQGDIENDALELADYGEKAIRNQLSKKYNPDQINTAIDYLKNIGMLQENTEEAMVIAQALAQMAANFSPAVLGALLAPKAMEMLKSLKGSAPEEKATMDDLSELDRIIDEEIAKFEQ